MQANLKARSAVLARQKGLSRMRAKVVASTQPGRDSQRARRTSCLTLRGPFSPACRFLDGFTKPQGNRPRNLLIVILLAKGSSVSHVAGVQLGQRLVAGTASQAGLMPGLVHDAQ